MKIDLKDYKKLQPRRDKVTSVNITPEQDQFLKDNGLNLSKLIRDHLDRIIRESKKVSSF